ncbi:MAG: nuclease-related domain-containing protein [Solirubrobacteraceae bacterium]
MLRRDDRCAICHAPLRAGVRASWSREQRTVACLTCVPATQAAGSAPARERAGSGEVETGAAGASALREYERRRAARERQLAGRFGLLGSAYARLSSDPVSTASWKQGAEGERKLAKRLAKLAGHDVLLLHDRRMPHSRRANIDHVAVGRGGVTVIDAKALHGQVRIESVGGVFSPRRRRLLVAGRDETRLIEGVRAQRAAVVELLAAGGDELVDVRSALCFVVSDGLPWRQLQMGETLISGPKRIAALARREGTLSREEVERLHRRLAGALPPA